MKVEMSEQEFGDHLTKARDEIKEAMLGLEPLDTPLRKVLHIALRRAIGTIGLVEGELKDALGPAVKR